MVYLLALASAAFYGAADFIGGLTSRRASTIAIVVISQSAGLVALAMLLPILPGALPRRADIVWGAAAGLSGGAGVALLYRALAIGTMSVVAPTTAVCAVVIPVIFEIATGERLATTTAIGIGLAIVAIVLVSQQRTPARRTRPSFPPGIGLALVSGVAIGLFFLALARTSPAAGLWPLLVARIVSVGVFGIGAMSGGASLRMPREVLVIAGIGGVLDMLANALYLVASRHGSLSVVVTLSSLYPASTVILAWIVLGERLNAAQMAGIVCALIAVLLIVQ
jgi:drug/metabolite transporter (DMT)-like permease